MSAEVTLDYCEAFHLQGDNAHLPLNQSFVYAWHSPLAEV
jgi:hypothetical protein